jgi:hypothetical protein
MRLGLADAKASKPAEGIGEGYGGDNAEVLFSNIRERYEGIMRFLKDNQKLLEAVKLAVNGKAIMNAYQEIHGTSLRGRHIGVLKTNIEEKIRSEKITDPELAREIMLEAVRTYMVG